MTANPFADPDTDAPRREREERNSELPDFFKMPDLVGRNVIIKPEKIETVPDGKYGPYEKLTAEFVIVLDGRKNELFPQLPRSQRNVWIYDRDVIVELKPFLNPKDAEHFGKAAVGYVTLEARTKKLILEKGALDDPEIAKKAHEAWERYEKDGQVGYDPLPSTPDGKPPF